MRRYDFIIAGGGAAGLSLACHLIRSPLRDCSILIVDKDAKDRNDRTWAFWTSRPTLFDRIVQRSWRQVRVLSDDGPQTVSLRAFRYNVMRGIDFYRFAKQSLAERPTVERRVGTVDQIVDGNDHASVVVDGERYAGTWVFDSLYDWRAFQPHVAHFRALTQQFKGWEIETPALAFDPEAPTLLDLRTPQREELRFFYLLPFSERHALVESVLCAAAPASWDGFDQALEDYARDRLGLKQYRVCRTERGITPLTDQPFQRRAGHHIMTIGIRGGRIKPSTGYAFTRIQQDSSAIVQSLLRTGVPFSIPPSPRRYRFFDSVLLQILADHGEAISPILRTLFKRNPGDRVLRFLDERASVWENLVMVPSLPPALLWRSLVGLGALGRV